MDEQIVIGRAYSQLYTALISDGVVSDIRIHQADEPSLLGNIYLGTVVRVLAGMQAAFVDIGRQKTAFLPIDELRPSVKHIPIEHRLHQGERLLVQVIKDETHSKGARLSTNIVLSSAQLVYRPYDKSDVRVSAKLSVDERRRLMAILRPLTKDANIKGSVIARTQAHGADDNTLKDSLDKLLDRHHAITQKAAAAKLNKAKHAAIDVQSAVAYALSQFVNHRTKHIVLDDAAWLDEVQQNVQSMTNIDIELYQGKEPMFEAYGIGRAIDEALCRQVMLPSGGSLIFDYTEALIVIDVNSGAFVDKHSDSKTVYQTNLEAAFTIAKHIRLRNLGGMIVIDFINMSNPTDNHAIMNALQTAIKSDRNPVSLIGMNELGLVMLTRKRTDAKLADQLHQPCPMCAGVGTIKQPKMVAFDIIRDLLKQAHNHNLNIVAHPAVIDYLHSHECDTLQDIKALSGHHISLNSNLEYHLDTYQIVYD